MSNNKNIPSPKSFEELISEYLAAGGEYSENTGREPLVVGNYKPPAWNPNVGEYGKINVSPNASIIKGQKYKTIFHELMHMLDDKSSPDSSVNSILTNQERADELDMPLKDFEEAQKLQPKHPLFGNEFQQASFSSDKLEDLSKKQGKPLVELFKDLAYYGNTKPKRTKYITKPTEFVSFVTEGSDEGFYDELEDMFDPFSKNKPKGGEKSIHDLVRLAESVNEAFDIGKENIKGGKDIFSSKSINFLNSYLENTRNKYLSLGNSRKEAKGDNILKQIQESYNKDVKWVTTKYGTYKKFKPDKSPNKYNLPQKYDKPWY